LLQARTGQNVMNLIEGEHAHLRFTHQPKGLHFVAGRVGLTTCAGTRSHQKNRGSSGPAGGGVVADGNDKVDWRCALLRELVPGLASQSLCHMHRGNLVLRSSLRKPTMLHREIVIIRSVPIAMDQPRI